MTLAEYAELVGVTPNTIYKWEHGASRPPATQLEKWLAIKGMPKEAAWEKLGIEPVLGFSARMVAAERRRLGLSAQEYADLIGISMTAVFNWEKGRSVPWGPAQEKWLTVKGMPKEAVWRKLGIEVHEFSSKAILAERKRLGLSVTKYARLVGVSEPTIYDWEKGKSVPREDALEKWLAIKGIGKAKAEKKLGLG